MPNTQRTELAGAVSNVTTNLADCIGRACQVGALPPNSVYALLLDLEVWARELRGEPAGPTAALARLVREHDTAPLLTRPYDWPT